MAADDAAVVVTLRANLKDYEAALKSAVRATEKAAKSAEAAVSGIGKKAPVGQQISQNFSKSSAQVVNDARVMQYQLNDIFSGLASGQGIRALQVQLGQIAQQMSGGSLAAGARLMGTALVGMINPINLAVVAFGLAAAAAASFFSDTEEDAKKAADAVKKIADELDRIAQAHPGSPVIQEVAEQAQAAADAAQNNADEQTILNKVYEEADKIVKDFKVDMVDLVTQLMNFGDEGLTAGNRIQSAFKKLETAIKERSDATDELIEVDKALAEVEALGIQSAKTYGEAFDAIADKFKKVSEQGKDVIDTFNAVRDAAEVGVIGPPVPAPGFILEGKEIMEAAKKQREEAQRAAEEAAREAERASEAGKREAEQAAKEATERLNRAIANQTKVAVDAAAGLIGKSETANAAEINAFLKRGGVDLDAATTAWCAAFVNSALAQVGIKGTGSNVATSFAGWGRKVDLAEIQRGDVLVESRGRRPGQTGGHVGFATGQVRATAEGITQVEMLSGNASDQVQTDWVNATDVIARRAADAFQLPADALSNLTEESRKAAEEAKKLADQQARASQQFSQAISQMAQSAIGGLVNDLRNGVEAGEAFNNMLNRIIDSLIQMSLQALFSPQAMGGIIGSLLGVPAAAKGGIVGKTAFPRRMVDPRVFAGAPHFASGGLVGGEVPIIAHRGEMIVPKAMVGRGGANVTNNLGTVNIDMSASGMVSAGTDQARQFGLNVQKLIQVEMVRESRPGGLLRRV